MEAKEQITMTLKEFSNMESDDHSNYELINGTVIISPAPNTRHQMISGNLIGELGNFLKNITCRATF